MICTRAFVRSSARAGRMTAAAASDTGGSPPGSRPRWAGNRRAGRSGPCDPIALSQRVAESGSPMTGPDVASVVRHMSIAARPRLARVVRRCRARSPRYSMPAPTRIDGSSPTNRACASR
jgi:hypothetical protein